VSLIGPEIDGLTFLEHLGAGGYSDVYLYERRTPRMRVAVKVLKDARLSAGELAQFAAEAETMAELADHPYIVQVFSTGTLADARPYLVMKYYPPPNLGVRAAQSRMSLSDVLRTGVKIASAVETAHRAGILHRDIKPANVLVSQYGEPGLTDFGIAGHAVTTDDVEDIGVSIPWSAPEVLSGTSNGSVQSDVYALAATLWHLLVGRSPFEVPGGDNAPRALMSRILRAGVPSSGRADAPASLERLLAQSMAKNAAVRPRSALEFARALQGIEQEQRFARTEIIVEGLGAARTTTGDRPAPPAGADATRLRAPVRVDAQPPAAPQRRVAAPVPPPFPPPVAATVARPAAPKPEDGVRRRVDPPSASPAATVHRPVNPTAPPEAVAAPTRRGGLRRAHVSLIAAAVVVAAIVVGIVLSSGDSPSRRAGTTPTVADTRDLNPAAAAPDPPTVNATYDSARKKVRFTWRGSADGSGARFEWYPAGDPSSATRTSQTHVEVAKLGTAQVCIEVVQIDADGRPSDPTRSCA